MQRVAFVAIDEDTYQVLIRTQGKSEWVVISKKLVADDSYDVEKRDVALNEFLQETPDACEALKAGSTIRV